MKKLLNKTFFKFTAGFMGIIAVAVLGVFILGAYQSGSITVVESTQSGGY